MPVLQLQKQLQAVLNLECFMACYMFPSSLISVIQLNNDILQVDLAQEAGLSIT